MAAGGGEVFADAVLRGELGEGDAGGPEFITVGGGFNGVADSDDGVLVAGMNVAVGTGRRGILDEGGEDFLTGIGVGVHRVGMGLGLAAKSHKEAQKFGKGMKEQGNGRNGS